MSIEIEARGVRYPVTVSESGLFAVDVNGTVLRSDTFAGLREKVKDHTGKVNVDIPFTYYAASGPWQGTVRRLHTNGRDILVTREGQGGGPVSVPAYESKNILARLDDAQLAELRHLIAVQETAQAALDRFKEAHARNIRREIQDIQPAG